MNVSVLGSGCLGVVGLCLLPPSMNPYSSKSSSFSYILPHSPEFAETICAVFHLNLMPPPAFTAVISVPPGQSSSSSAEFFTVLLHLSHFKGTKVRYTWFDASWDRTPELQSGTLSIEPPRHPQIINLLVCFCPLPSC